MEIHNSDPIDVVRLKLGLLLLTSLNVVCAQSQPVINSVNPRFGNINTNVTITGNGFNAIPSNNTVYFGGVQATVTSASPTSLVVKAPTGINSMPISVLNNNLSAYYYPTFGVTFPGSGFNTGSFTSEINIPSPGIRFGITSSDIDGDGKIDIIYSSLFGQSFTVLKNTSSNLIPQFEVGLETKTDVFSVAITSGDLNGDGKLDIILNDWTVDSMYVYLNTSSAGNISFGSKISLHIPERSNQISIADVDLDGKPDIVSVGDFYFSIMLNKTSSSTLSFDAGVTFPGNAVLAIADVNLDNKPDLVTRSGFDVSVLINNSVPGNVSFAEPLYLGGAQDYFINAISVNNLTDDNMPDIAVAASGNSATKILLYKNISNGPVINFESPVIIPKEYSMIDISTVDMDGDSKPDIVLAGDIFKNRSTDSFSFDDKSGYGSNGGRYSQLEIADFSNDGKPDISGFTDDLITVIFNRIGDPPHVYSFTPTSGGAGTHVSISGVNLTITTSVVFGNVPAASFRVISDNLIEAIVGSAGASGSIKVFNNNGVDSIPGFSFINIPVIDSVSVLKAATGQSLRIYGKYFNPVFTNNSVHFGAAKGEIFAGTSTTTDVLVPPGSSYQAISLSTNGYTVLSASPFHLTFLDGEITNSTFIKKYQPLLSDHGANNVKIADLDGDGKNDIFVNLHGSVFNGLGFYDSVSVYRNTTTNNVVTFSNKINFKTTGSKTLDVNFADFDGDGKLDVVAINEAFTDNGSVDIFRNASTPGNISFAQPIEFYIGFDITNISIEDIDKDGKLDFAISGRFNQVFIFRNTTIAGGNISFENVASLSIPPSSGNIGSTWLGDIDGDKKPDLVVTASSGNNIYVYNNNSGPGEISFKEVLPVNIGHISRFAIMGDIDGDQKQDLILSVDGEDSVIVVVRNISTAGNILFDNNKYIVTYHPGNVVLADLDGDGKIDLCASSTREKNILALRNTSTIGNLSFSPKINYAAGFTDVQGIDVGDLDMDGRPDIVVADYDKAVFGVFINQNIPSKNVCSNSNTTIDAHLAGIIYQWQMDSGNGFADIYDNANYQGTATSSLKILTISPAWYGYKFRCVVDGNADKSTVLKFQNIWTGAVNSQWENAGNWSCGSVPDFNTNVFINAGTVVINSNVTIRTLQLKPGASLTVLPSNNLTVTH